ncbi:MAG: calcium/sodium antiporter [Flavobacteriales bacterium]|nr:calcium/sodium antiporter [Flavobacteriales bacterium]MCB9173440.1 calcium/sodium antiporter [Flavobacteriales bacterium]
MEYVLLIAGLVTLIFGGDALVKGAVGIALKFNISSLVIGMTVVAFGTSMPELLVSIKAAIENHPEIAIGNVVGSNIANIALVLGLTTMILPIPVKFSTVRVDWPIMMIASILFYLFILNGVIEWWEGLIFSAGILLFTYLTIKKSSVTVNHDKIEDIQEDELEEVEKKAYGLLKSIMFVIVGILGLTFGASWLLDGAVQIAQNFGLSEHVIGVTIVAFGTSVPELATSVVAACKKETDISVGNLIGSNIFNILAVLGFTALVKEIPVSNQVITNDAYWMLGISLLLFPLMYYKYNINRLKGLVLFTSYLVYLYFVLK